MGDEDEVDDEIAEDGLNKLCSKVEGVFHWVNHDEAHKLKSPRARPNKSITLVKADHLIRMFAQQLRSERKPRDSNTPLS